MNAVLFCHEQLGLEQRQASYAFLRSIASGLDSKITLDNGICFEGYAPDCRHLKRVRAARTPPVVEIPVTY
jgi:hypothetical protein